MAAPAPTPQRSPPYALVAVGRPVGGALTYLVPEALRGLVQVGHVVLVPLGTTGETGYVVGFEETTEVPPGKLREIRRLVDPVPAFGEGQLEFFRWIAKYYLTPLGMVLAAAIPGEMKARTVQALSVTSEGTQALALKQVGAEAASVLRELISRPHRTRKALVKRLADELSETAVIKAVEGLIKAGWLVQADREIGEVQGRVTTVALVGSPEAALKATARPGPRFKALVELLHHGRGPIDLPEVIDEIGESARDGLAKLEAAGLVVRGQREQRDALVHAAPLGDSRPPPLNEDQKRALQAILGSAPTPWLLFGVTGSGKTEVFLGCAADTLERGRQVLVLVPEIGLTPQLVGRFKARFGERVAVLHSQLSHREKLSEWRRIRSGDARIAVGARSALFAPFGDLGLVVVDEEHDDSYKQDEGVRYHARDLAVVLGRLSKAPVILASATPSFESWQNAEAGRYGRLDLPRRATPRPVPVVELVDMTALEKEEGKPRPMFAPETVKALAETFERGGQAIVLYNRRGFATMVECGDCGGTFECPNCGITMTLHRARAEVACHWCGFHLPYDGSCPVCRSRSLDELGKGTERVEEELGGLFPGVTTARMDADTVQTKGAHGRILAAFRSGEVQLLVGTQIVAKGHDFPGVHTAVVVSADHGLRIPDFRSAERTFALLVQVAGRAGRGEVPGRVIVQTWKPDHPVLKHQGDLPRFYDDELKLRKMLRYPPWSRLCLIRLEGPQRGGVEEVARELVRDLRGVARGYPGVAVMGPNLAALPKLVGRWRYQVVVRGLELGPHRAFLEAVLPRLQATSGGGVRAHWDVDPRHLV